MKTAILLPEENFGYYRYSVKDILGEVDVFPAGTARVGRRYDLVIVLHQRDLTARELDWLKMTLHCCSVRCHVIYKRIPEFTTLEEFCALARQSQREMYRLIEEMESKLQ